MEKLKLKFETETDVGLKRYEVEVPYKDGIVITNEFCPTEMISGNVELLAAFRGEALDKFMKDCRRQVMAMSEIAMSEIARTENAPSQSAISQTNEDEGAPQLDLHIGALMAVVMDHLSRHRLITFGDLLNYVDCFALLLSGAGFDEKEIREIYPRVVNSIVELYPENIKSQ